MKKSPYANNEANRVRFGLFALFGVLLFLIGLAALICSIIDLFHGRPRVAHYDESLGGLKIENPLWPSSGKGFWVGLVLMVTGLVGLLASREGTRASIIGFTALAVVSTILSFYMLITCIIPVQYLAENTDRSRVRWQSNELVLNSLLIAFGALGSIVGLISSLLSCSYAGCCRDQRRSYLFQSPGNANKAMSMRYPSGNIPPMAYPYPSGNLRMPM